jgi:hypothetical protein
MRSPLGIKSRQHPRPEDDFTGHKKWYTGDKDMAEVMSQYSENSQRK